MATMSKHCRSDSISVRPKCVPFCAVNCHLAGRQSYTSSSWQPVCRWVSASGQSRTMRQRAETVRGPSVQTMWAREDVCGLFADNVGPRQHVFADNVGFNYGLFVGQRDYVCGPLQLWGGQKPYTMCAETRIDFPRVIDSLLPWPQGNDFGHIPSDLVVDRWLRRVRAAHPLIFR